MRRRRFREQTPKPKAEFQITSDLAPSYVAKGNLCKGNIYSGYGLGVPTQETGKTALSVTLSVLEYNFNLSVCPVDRAYRVDRRLGGVTKKKISGASQVSR